MVAAVPRQFPDETIVCVATGPSLTPADVEACRGRRVIAVKDAIRLCPWADVLYACDARWWRTHHATLGEDVTTLRYSLESAASPWATVLRNTGDYGLETNPTGLRTGRNSGYQAINLAVHLGARRIVLLGYDLAPAADGRAHWFGAHPWTTRPWEELGPFFRPYFASLVEPLRALGIAVLNATRRTALSCFPTVDLAEAFA